MRSPAYRLRKFNKTFFQQTRVRQFVRSPCDDHNVKTGKTTDEAPEQRAQPPLERVALHGSGENRFFNDYAQPSMFEPVGGIVEYDFPGNQLFAGKNGVEFLFSRKPVFTGTGTVWQMLNGQPFSALLSSSTKHKPSVWCTHPATEAVCPLPPKVAWLIRPFHNPINLHKHRRMVKYLF